MEASGVTASLRPKEVLESRHEFTEEDLELALANMACVDLIFKFQATQTDSTTQDFGVNTDADWESQVAAMFEYSVTLSDKYEKLMLKQSDEEAATELHKINLQKKKEEATRQHLALLEKLESLRVKLQLNNSKATKKNFLSKKQEMTSEKTRAEDERNRLAKELEDSERKLSSLSSEHSEEQRRWTEELEELRSEMERVRRDAQEKELIALKDEISAVERQRDTAMGHIQAWLGEVGVYLNTLRVEFPQQFPQERVKWEKQEEAVIRSKAELERRYQDVLQQLQQGRELESLPTINMPALPQVPMAQLRFNQVMQTIVRPHFMPPPNQRHLHPPPPHTHAPIPNPNPHFYQPQPGHFIPPQFQHRHRFNPPPPNQPQPNINQHHYIAPAHPPTQPMRAPQIPNLPIGAQQPLQNPIRAPVQPQNPMNGSPVNPVSPSPPPATAKLDMVLEKLGARFPQCDRAQLTSLLQQVKSSRGTLAGMSMEDLMDHVNRLIQNGRSAPGPISRPTPPGPIQRPTPPPDRRALGAVGLGRKPCLVCQNMVDLESRHPLSCSHTIHKDCIRMWLQTSKNNTCPFCG